MSRMMSEKDSAPWIEEKFIRLDGTEIDVECSGVSFTYGGKPAVQMIFRDITERKTVEERLQRLALYDTLTGLPNRTLFFDRMNQLLALAKRNQYVLALLYMDLDRFKNINDTLGHEVGDLLLTEAGAAHDVVHPEGRYGRAHGRRRVHRHLRQDRDAPGRGRRGARRSSRSCPSRF